MLIPKESFFDRIEQTFILFKNNFKNIFLGYFLYKFVVFIIIGNIIYYGILKFIDLDSFNFDKSENIIADLFSNTYFIIGVNIFLILLILNLILIIPFILGTIKTIKEAFEEKDNINLLENIKYGFKNINNSFKIYWYIFVYVALIPSIFIIIGWLLFALGRVKHINILLLSGGYILIFSFFFLMISFMYKGLKTNFSIVSAVDKNIYSKNNFDFSIKITNGNWVRILGNYIFIGIILYLVGLILNFIIGIFYISSYNLNSFQNIDLNKVTQEDIQNIILNLSKSIGGFSINSFLVNIIKLVINTISIIFMFIFNYVFYKRLKYEYETKNNNLISEDIIKEL